MSGFSRHHVDQLQIWEHEHIAEVFSNAPHYNFFLEKFHLHCQKWDLTLNFYVIKLPNFKYGARLSYSYTNWSLTCNYSNTCQQISCEFASDFFEKRLHYCTTIAYQKSCESQSCVWWEAHPWSLNNLISGFFL